MKNIYLYGASDDLREIDTDFDVGYESDHGDIDICLGGVTIATVEYHYRNGDWEIEVNDENRLPPDFIVTTIRSVSTFIHIQVPDEAQISFRDHD